jgi:hypothetical protein
MQLAVLGGTEQTGRALDRGHDVVAFVLDCLKGDLYVHEMPRAADR